MAGMCLCKRCFFFVGSRSPIVVVLNGLLVTAAPNDDFDDGDDVDGGKSNKQPTVCEEKVFMVLGVRCYCYYMRYESIFYLYYKMKTHIDGT